MVHRGRKRKLSGDKFESYPEKKECKTDDVHSAKSENINSAARNSYRELFRIGLSEPNLVVLEGPIGCGKRTIINEVANTLNLPVEVFQIGDELDAKSIFGIFHCLEVPGEFLWKPSAFTKALKKPGIIVLKDLDIAAPDLISLLVDLCEKRKVNLVNGEFLEMHKNAHIVGTAMTITDGTSERKSSSDLLLSNAFLISLPSFTEEELCWIISSQFGRLAPFARKFVSLYTEVNNYWSSVLGRSTRRVLTTVDLIRGCKRLDNLDDLLDSAAILNDLIDVWAMHCLDEEDMIKIAQLLASRLSVNIEYVDFYLRLRKPEISITQSEIVCGRAKFLRSREFSSNSSAAIGITNDVCRLLERVLLCIKLDEPVLLVGDSGVGKTALIQTIASYANVRLHVVNLSQHSDSSDLIGGFKPISTVGILRPLRSDYECLFAETFDVKKNTKFLNHLDTCISAGRYTDYLKLIIGTARKVISSKYKQSKEKAWANICVRAKRIEKALKSSALSFGYVQGVVAEAASKGEWVLVDEINLALPECLDAISHVLEDTSRNPNFRLFACMNPALDVGKRNLPVGVRTKFAEFFVRETTDLKQLSIIARVYMPSIDAKRLNSVLHLYEKLKQEFPGKYSLRTLCRALSFASENFFGDELRNLYQAFCMSFITDANSLEKVKIHKIILDALGVSSAGMLTRPGNLPSSGRGYINVEGYWVKVGTEEPFDDPNYVRTKSVKENLSHLARIICSARYPVLLEGETSAGKTAMVTYLANVTGNKVIRINNHEHTDLQEYIGSYVPDADGRFGFVEGALLKAVREGYWVILDELNLAPTDVIEALNRLLDDNKELFVPELNTVVKAHSSFRLFATQNPVSTYAGRKRLSKALLNRFVVLRYDQLPFEELAEIVVSRCGVHRSAADKMISVLCELRAIRSSKNIFLAKDSLMTLRDVFRWAKRLVNADYTDWLQCLADHGYFLLACRCRSRIDEEFVVKAIEKHLKRKVQPDHLFALDSPYMPSNIINTASSTISWTLSTSRMVILCTQAWKCNEPVLMVGETGCGKTTVAELISGEKLLSMNCHESTETSDFLGSLRPVGDGSFKWMDGIVVQAMKEGSPLLIDEISLAADSVLERLNPLFELSRTLLLTDSGAVSVKVAAEDGFQVIATMNPGGDYGKKELSKALRNRFTEIWCPSAFSSQDIETIIIHRMQNSEKVVDLVKVASCITQFIVWYSNKYSHVFRCVVSVRDVVAIAETFKACCCITSPGRSLFHAFSATLFDAFGASPTRVPVDLNKMKQECFNKLTDLVKEYFDDGCVLDDLLSGTPEVFLSAEGDLRCGEFFLSHGVIPSKLPKWFNFNAPTCRRNVYRTARSLTIDKPVLLEGPPGCGKSSLITALASATGHKLTRLNLSDQTELSDLFGMDIPVISENGKMSFAWSDGPVLKAIKEGQWILLDEMNLASQSILEGLNACFDYRHQLFLPEINRRFDIVNDGLRARFFACQNPSSQGGSRRSLPKSFLNRFTPIYISEMTSADEAAIIGRAFSFPEHEITAMIAVKNEIIETSRNNDGFFVDGGPFEFNLRDLLRWAELACKCHDFAYAFDLLFVARLRTDVDQKKAVAIFERNFGVACKSSISSLFLTDYIMRIGRIELGRSCSYSSNLKLLSSQMRLLEMLGICVKMEWLVLLVGPRGVGKLSAVKNLAALTGNQLKVMRLTSETDAMELLGTFEQAVTQSNFRELYSEAYKLLEGTQFAIDVTRCEDSFALARVLDAAALLLPEDRKSLLQDLITQLNNNSMKFLWRNSPFLDAYLNGGWIAVEDVNCCSAAVLDRLNVCLESNGELLLSEKGGSQEAIRASPDFRVFFTMDAKHGSLSRAMRNRTVEIYVMPESYAWFNHPTNLLDVVLPESFSGDFRRVSTLSKVLNNVPETQLQKCRAILNAFEVNEATTYISSFVEDQKSDDAAKLFDTGDLCIRYPSVHSCLLNELERWKWTVLKSVAKDDVLNGFVWALLSSSLKTISSGTFQQEFPSIDGSLIDGIVAILQSSDPQRNEMPFDDRICGTVVLPNRNTDYVAADRVIMATFSYWIFSYVSSMKISEGSGMEESVSFREGRIRSDELSSPALQYLCDFIGDLKALLKNPFRFQHDHLIQAIETALDLIIFLDSCYSTLDTRTSCASMQLAWQRVQASFCTRTYDSVNFARIVGEINKLWAVFDNSELLKSLEFHNHSAKIFAPFNSTEGLDKVFTGVSRSYLALTESMKSDRLKANYEMQKDTVVEVPLKIASQFFCAFMFLKRMDYKKALEELFIQLNVRVNEMFLVNEFTWSSGPVGDVVKYLCFSSFDFAVTHVPLATKNCDLAYVSLELDLMAAVWRNLGYDTGIHSVSMGELKGFTKEVSRISSLLWKICPNLKDFRTLNSSAILQTISVLKELFYHDLVGDKLIVSDQNETPLMTLGRIGYEIMNLSASAVKMVDPVIILEQRCCSLSNKMSLIQKQLKILKEFFYFVNGNISSSFLDQSSHPLINCLAALEERYQKELNSLEQKDGVYRPEYKKFAQLSFELNSFCELTSECHSTVIKKCENGYDLLPINSLDLIKSQLESFIFSATLFMKRLLEEFLGYPDIIFPYLLGLQSFMLYACDIKFSVEVVLDKKRLEIEYSLPSSCTVTWNSSYQRLFAPDLFSWAISERSTMPVCLQIPVLKRMWSEKMNIDLVFSWIGRNWSCWYDENTRKKESLYVFRKKEVEEEEIDDDKELLLSLFPLEDFEEESDTSRLCFEAVAKSISDFELEDLLMYISGNGSEEVDDYMSLMWLASVFRPFGFNNSRIRSLFTASHFNGLQKLDLSCSLPINVYKTNVPSESIRCVDLLQRLIEKVKQLKEVWPEVVVFDNICQCSENLLNLPSSTPQIRLASSVERLLNEVNEWEKISSREYSLKDEMNEIKTMLLDWRKMELLCWEAVLEEININTRRQSLLVAWPLFEAVMGSEKTNKEILLMVIEWIHAATLIDFPTRIVIPSLMSKIIEAQPEEKNERKKLVPLLQSIGKHFSQFKAVVCDRLTIQGTSLGKQLKDFIQVFKYNDLNVWSVKLSAEKAHRQLLRIVKQYKQCGEESVSSLLDQPLLPKNWEFPKFSILPYENLSPNIIKSYEEKARSLAEEIVQSITTISEVEILEELFGLCDECNKLLHTDIAYEGDEEAMLKQRGAALSEREKLVASLIKKLSKLGVRSRLGISVDSEKLTERALSCPDGNDCTFEKTLRLACVNRTIFVRRLHHPNKQITPQLISHLKGVTEFGLDQLLQYYELSLNMQVQLNELNNLMRMLRNQWINNKEGHFAFHHYLWTSRIQKIANVITSLGLLIKIIKNKTHSAPDESSSTNVEILFDTNLSLLHKNHKTLVELEHVLNDCDEVVQKVKEEIEKSLDTIQDVGEFVIWECSNVYKLKQYLRAEVERLKRNFNKFLNYFPDETEEGLKLCSLLMDNIEQTEEREENHISVSVLNDLRDMNLIVIQKVYRYFCEMRDNYAGWTLKAHRGFAEVIKNVKLSVINSNLKEVLLQFSKGSNVSDQLINSLLNLLTVVHSVLNTTAKGFDVLNIRVTAWYLLFQNLGIRLLQKGFVNDIPKIDDTKGDGEKMEGNDEVAGMGEGVGANDVSDQIEETGEIEGLKENELENNQPGEPKKESEKPIDLDEDFIGDADSIGISEDGEDNGSEDESEPEMDDTVGKVDEDVDETVDPQIWGPDEQDESDGTKDYDEGDEGAKKKGDDLVASDGNKPPKESPEESCNNESETQDEKDMENVDERDTKNEESIKEKEEACENDGSNGAEETDINEFDDDAQGSDAETDMICDSSQIDENEESEQGTEEATQMEEEAIKDNEEAKDEEKENVPDKAEACLDGGNELADNPTDGSHQDRKTESNDIKEKKDEDNGTECSENYKGIKNTVNNEEGKPSNADEIMDEFERGKYSEECRDKTEDKTLEREVAPDAKVDELEELDEADGEVDMEGENFGSNSKEMSGTLEKFVVKESSIEEAKLTKDLLSKRTTNISATVTEEPFDSREKDDDLSNHDNVGIDDAKKDEVTQNKSFIIHTSSDFYELAAADGDSCDLAIKFDSYDVLDERTDLDGVWCDIEQSVSVLSSELAENLRMTIEPTVASKLQGDYRSGKRLNMKRLVPYIASDYRKDRIWLRRTKKAKRNYQVLLAVDDSLSMEEHKLNYVTFQSVCLIESALRQLEIGQLAICKFGRTVKMIRDFESSEDLTLGKRLLSELTFSQDRTDLVNLLNCGRKIFDDSRSAQHTSQMMIIVSDGRGALASDPSKIVTVCRTLHSENVTVLFVAIDSAEKSIVDMKVAEFNADGNVVLTPYLDRFPFPFYLIVNHISLLPATLADAIRQWFQLTIYD